MPPSAGPVTTASEYARARDERRSEYARDERRSEELLYGRWGAELRDEWEVDRSQLGSSGRSGGRQPTSRAQPRSASASASASAAQARSASDRPARTSRAADRDRAERGVARPRRPRSDTASRRSVTAAQVAAAQALADPSDVGGSLGAAEASVVEPGNDWREPGTAGRERRTAPRGLGETRSSPVFGDWDYVAEPLPHRSSPGRETVTIAGRGAEAYADRRGTRPSSAQRHQAIRRHEREGFRPDRVAMWAVALGVMLMLAAAASSHAAVLAAHHVLSR